VADDEPRYDENDAENREWHVQGLSASDARCLRDERDEPEDGQNNPSDTAGSVVLYSERRKIGILMLVGHGFFCFLHRSFERAERLLGEWAEVTEAGYTFGTTFFGSL
jgi:hypothetical protein